MNEQLCIRCQHPVALESGHLSFCSNCGAPQIFLSEDLQAEIAQQTEQYNQRSAAQLSAESPVSSAEGENSAVTRSRPDKEAWPLAVQYALFAAAITLALGLLSLLLPPVSVLTVLWAITAPVLTVGFYNARNPSSTPTTSGFAARLGLLTGLLVVACCAAVFTLSLVLTRYVLHDAALLDTQLATSFEQQRVAALKSMGASVQPTLDMFALPEFRVGLLLSMTATLAAMYLFLSTVAAGLAGAVLQRRRSI